MLGPLRPYACDARRQARTQGAAGQQGRFSTELFKRYQRSERASGRHAGRAAWQRCCVHFLRNALDVLFYDDLARFRTSDMAVIRHIAMNIALASGVSGPGAVGAMDNLLKAHG